MFSNFGSFKDIDFDHFNEHSSDLNDKKCDIFAHDAVKQINDPTTFEESCGFEDFVMSRNLATNNRDYEISFESTFQ